MLALLLGGSWASGVNLYLTVAGLGIAGRMGWMQLPGELQVLGEPIIIGVALLLYIIEFFADKIPYVDSAWDSVHTFIRPVGAAAIAYMAAPEAEPLIQTAAAFMGGTIALDSHLTKAATRIAINASPEPVSNTIASVAEDVTVIGALWLIIQHPIIVSVSVIVFFALSLWLMPKLIRLLIKGFKRVFGKKEERS